MRFKVKNIIIISIVLLAMLLLINNVYASEIKKGNYSKKYEEWLQLSDEEKEKTIAPLAFNVRSSKKSLVDKFRNLLKSSSIPSRYDLREHINVEVKNQMDTGECWAFSANSSLETYLAIKNQNYNFSERHLEYATASNFIGGTNERALNRKIGDGGSSSTAFTYYSRGDGPIKEEDMPFLNNQYPINISELPQNINVKKIDNMIFFPSIFKKLDENNNLVYTDGNGAEYSKTEINEIRNEIKTHIMNCGGITIDILAPTMYYNEDTHAANFQANGFANHSVTIIGWDDNYSKNNFNDKPDSNGAYIILNSWGDEWGENGIYYISYEDFLVETSMRGVTSISDIEYDKLYQYDMSEMCNYINAQYAANVFTAQENGKLTQVMIGSLSNQTCNIYISVEENEFNINNRIKVANNVLLKPGYNTISLTSNINISKEKKFAVIVELINDNFEGIGIEDSTAFFGKVVSNTNESFISSNGSDWNDIYDSSNMMNLSIKAYTQDEQKSFKLIDIKGQAYESFGGQFSVIFDTSYTESESPIEINIYNGEENVTSIFNITNNKVKGKGAFIKIECPTEINHGTYSLQANLKDYNTINTEFTVQEIPEDFITITFNDENLYGNIQMLINNYIKNDSKLQIIASKNEIENIESIELEGKGISYLRGIECFINLKKLDLSNNNIEDLAPLSQLENIEYLNLNSNSNIELVSLNAISNYKNIRELYLEFNPGLLNITDSEGIIIDLNYENIDIITSLKTLTVLDISNTGITNIDWISELNNLKSLFLDNNSSIKDFSILENLTNIEKLKLGGLEINNLEILENFKNLKELELIGNNIEDISSLENLKELTKLELGSNNIENINVIRHLNKLKYLDLSDNNISNIDSLENFTYFDYLSLQNNRIKDITPLNNLINYGWLVLNNNCIEDISAIHKPMDMWGLIFLYENIINKEVTINEENEVFIELPQILKVVINKNNDFDFVYSNYSLQNCKLSEEGDGILIDPSESMTASIIVNGGSALGTRFNVSLKFKEEESLSGISITTPPNKTSYIAGQNFDETGMVVTANYNDGSSREVTDYIVTDGNNLTIEKTNVTISYTENDITRETTQQITVVNKELTGIEVITSPAKTDYFVGENFSQEGMQIRAIYNDGSSNEITNYRIVDGNNLNYGQNTISISYTENEITKFTTQKINVLKKMIGIEVINPPNKVDYINGENFDATGMIVVAKYNDESSEKISDYLITNGVNLHTGQVSIIIGYTKSGITVTTEQEITVTNNITEITIKSVPNRITYVQGENLDVTGGIIEATYQDGSKQEVNMTVDMLSGYDKNTLGEQTITVVYLGKTATFKVMIVKPEIIFNDIEVYERDNNFYIKISPQFTIEELTAKINQEVLLNNIPYYENLTEDGKLRTGSKILLNGEEKYTVIVKGDTNGDGLANIKDMIKINNYRLYGTITNFEDVYQDAADVNKDGSVDIKDMIRINNYRLYGTEF